jgi:hypothetical protein
MAQPTQVPPATAGVRAERVLPALVVRRGLAAKA